jgi:hypothetical protein
MDGYLPNVAWRIIALPKAVATDAGGHEGEP